MLTRDSIINIQDYDLKEVQVTEWGGSVYLRKWSGKDRSYFWSKSIIADESGAKVNWDSMFNNMVLAVSLSLCDGLGCRLFSNSDKDLAILGSKNGDVIQRLYSEAISMNGLAADSLNEAAKNSENIPSSDSTTV